MKCSNNDLPKINNTPTTNYQTDLVRLRIETKIAKYEQKINDLRALLETYPAPQPRRRIQQSLPTLPIIPPSEQFQFPTTTTTKNPATTTTSPPKLGPCFPSTLPQIPKQPIPFPPKPTMLPPTISTLPTKIPSISTHQNIRSSLKSPLTTLQQRKQITPQTQTSTSTSTSSLLSQGRGRGGERERGENQRSSNKYENERNWRNDEKSSSQTTRRCAIVPMVNLQQNRKMCDKEKEEEKKKEEEIEKLVTLFASPPYRHFRDGSEDYVNYRDDDYDDYDYDDDYDDDDQSVIFDDYYL